MKHLFFLLLTLSSLFSFAQTDSLPEVSEMNSAWKADTSHFPLKKGFYKTYQEFLTNSPSVQREFTINKKSSEAKQKLGTYAVTFDVADGEDKVGKIWGFCDGKAVYAKASPLETRYWKVEYIAPYSYFVHYFQPKSFTQLIAAAASNREFSVFNSKGKCQYAYHSYLKKLFDKCPGLLAEFKQQKNNADESVEREYLIKLNDYLATHPEPIKD